MRLTPSSIASARYYPRVALVQLAGRHGIALIDPLAVDLTPLARLLDGPGIAVLHASQQDLEVLIRSCGTIPREMFDTQLAAGFLGHSSPALVNLLSSELGVKLVKGDRLTDWLARPLSDDQRAYAASDVAHLLPLRDRLLERLSAVGRAACGRPTSARSCAAGPSVPPIPIARGFASRTTAT